MTPRSKSSAPTRPTGTRWLLAVALILAAGLAYSAASYLPFISDDALISLRYADRFLDGDGLTWTDGERVEGYSNLLWILLNAALGLIGFDLIDASRILGFAGFLAVLAALLRTQRPADATSALPALVAGLGLTLCGPVAVWTIGGLEQPLLAGLLAWSLAALLGRIDSGDDESDLNWRLPGLLLALVCLTRPDGIVLAGAVAIGVVLARPCRRSMATALRLLAVCLTTVALQTLFRLTYYGDWIPNTARAKVALSPSRWAEGFEYLGGGMFSLIALAAPALVFAAIALRDPARSARVRLLCAPLFAWAGYVVIVGGDLFPAYRQLVPLIVVFVFLLADGVADLVRRGGSSRVVASVVAVAALVVLGVMQQTNEQNQRAREERWEWDGEVIGRLLAEGFPERPLLAVDPAGTLPYFSGLPSVDMLGLNDRHIATHRPADFGEGSLGHELGDGPYVLGRNPDLVVFCGPAGGDQACFRSGREMLEDPNFRSRYTLVNFEGRHPKTFRSQIWVRTESPKIGIERDASRVVVPAWFLMAVPQSARLSPRGQLAVLVNSETPAGLGALELGPGSWTLQIEADGPPVRAMARLSGIETMLGGGIGGVTFRVDAEGGAPIDILLIPDGPDYQTFVRRLIFVRNAPR